MSRVITAGQRHDSVAFERVMAGIRIRRPGPGRPRSMAAVARHFAALSPVESNGYGCAFVEPNHKQELHITARPAADLPTTDMYIYSNPQHLTLSGNPGLISDEYGVAVIIDLRVPGGVLHGELRCLESQNYLAAMRNTFADIARCPFRGYRPVTGSGLGTLIEGFS